MIFGSTECWHLYPSHSTWAGESSNPHLIEGRWSVRKATLLTSDVEYSAISLGEPCWDSQGFAEFGRIGRVRSTDLFTKYKEALDEVDRRNKLIHDTPRPK